MSRLKNLFDLSARPDVIASHLSADAAVRGAGSHAPRACGFRAPLTASSSPCGRSSASASRCGPRPRSPAGWQRVGEPIETPFHGLDRLEPAPLRGLPRHPWPRLPHSESRPRVRQASARSPRPSPAASLIFSLVPIPLQQLSRCRRSRESATGPRNTSRCERLRWPDAFPAGDLVLLQGALATKSPQQLRERAEAWRPWRAYAAMYLWESQHLEEQESLDD